MHFFEKSCIFPVESRYICHETPKIFASCQLEKCRAATNGANPAKFTQQSHKRNGKDAPFMRLDTEKNPRRTKRNREFRQSPKFPYLCIVFLPHRIAHKVF